MGLSENNKQRGREKALSRDIDGDFRAFGEACRALLGWDGAGRRFYTIRDAAETAALSASNIGMMCRGYRPKADTIIKLADALRGDVRLLLATAGYLPETTVRVVFSKSIAGLLPMFKRYEPDENYTYDQQADGSVHVTGWGVNWKKPGFTRWLYQFLPDVEVLSPESLHADHIDLIDALQAKHRHGELRDFFDVKRFSGNLTSGKLAGLSPGYADLMQRLWSADLRASNIDWPAFQNQYNEGCLRAVYFDLEAEASYGEYLDAAKALQAFWEYPGDLWPVGDSGDVDGLFRTLNLSDEAKSYAAAALAMFEVYRDKAQGLSKRIASWPSMAKTDHPGMSGIDSVILTQLYENFGHAQIPGKTILSRD